MTRWDVGLEVRAFLTGLFGGLFTSLLGGWGPNMETLVIFMIVDVATGWILAGVFRQSGKTTCGGFKSFEAWKGITKKIFTLIVVLVAYRLQLIAGISFLRDAVVVAYIAVEGVSILENIGKSGLWTPEFLTKSLEDLKKRRGESENENREKDNSSE